MKSPSGWGRSLRVGLSVLALFCVTAPGAFAANAAKITADQGSSLPELEWLVLKPIPVVSSGSLDSSPDEAAQKQAFADDLLAAQGGEATVQATVGGTVTLNGKAFTWEKIEAHAEQTFNLQTPGAEKSFVVAYASAEFDLPAETKTLLGVGSDDHVKIWLNGKLVHQNWISRPVHLDDDVVPVTLAAGKNRLLLKIENGGGSWGFACRFLSGEALANRWVLAARRGDIDTLKRLLTAGVDINTTTSYGLNAYSIARLSGRSEVAAFLVQNGADPKSPLPSPEKWIDALITSHVSAGEPGVAVLVSRDGQILSEHGYGLANVAAGTAITPTTKFRIGSVTKQFTASAILKLAEQGKLKLSDPLSHYYPDFPRGSEVTLRHLLTHTSGIHSYTAAPDFLTSVTKPIAPAVLVASIQKTPFDFNPGQKWSYSNSGYFLLGTIVEKVSGQNYADFLSEMFFKPFGMVNTGIYQNGAPPSDAALGYQYEAGDYKAAPDWDMSWAGGAGAIYSTVEDLNRWNEAVFSGKVLSAENLKDAFTPVKTEENKDLPDEGGYGFGWGISRFRGAREISHGGGLHGFSSCLLRFPDQHLTVVVLANALPPKPGLDPGGLGHEIVESYLGTELEKVDQNNATHPVSDAALAALVGRYDAGRGVMEVTKEDGRVFVQLSGQPRFEIFAKSETKFFLKVVKAEITFVKDANGKVTQAVNHQNGMTLVWPRIESVIEVKLSSAQLDAVVGDYDYKGRTMTISREGDRLFALLTGQPKLELFAKSETEFFWKAVVAQLTVVKGPDGKVIKAIHQQGGHTLEVTKIK